MPFACKVKRKFFTLWFTITLIHLNFAQKINMIQTLKIKDRIAIPLVLRFLKPGGYAKFRTAEELRRKVELSGEELDYYEVNDQGNGVTYWNVRKDTGREFDFSEREVNVLKEGLENMDKRKVLNWDFIPLYEAFVPAAADPDEKTSHASDKTSDVSEEIPQQI